jgi:hypothetical protein
MKFSRSQNEKRRIETSKAAPHRNNRRWVLSSHICRIFGCVRFSTFSAASTYPGFLPYSNINTLCFDKLGLTFRFQAFFVSREWRGN